MPWWDVDLTSLFDGPEVAEGSAVASVLDKSNLLHVFYIGPSQHVYQFQFNSSTWTSQDLTSPPTSSPTPPETAVPPAATGTALSSFADNYGAHVIYVATDNNINHVHQLYLMWFDQILTSSVTVDVSGGLSGFVDTTGSGHVFYISSPDKHVHQLLFNNGTWTELDLTKNSNSTTTAAPGSALASFGDAYGWHVFYIAEDDTVHHLYFDNVHWVDQDLSGTASPAPPETTVPRTAAGTYLSAFVDSYGGHVFYFSDSQRIHHMNSTVYTAWLDQGLTSSIVSPDPPETTMPLPALGPLSSFGDNFGDHVVYLSPDATGQQHVHQLYFDNSKWVDQDLTNISNPVIENAVPPAATQSALTSLANTFGELVFYISADQHVHVLIYAPKPPIPQTIPGSIAIKCPTNNKGGVGMSYQSNVTASGGVAPYTYSIPGSQLPPGLTSDSSGNISGTPTQAGAYSFTVTVTDATQSPTTSECTITIGGAIQVACPTSGEVGVPYQSPVVASGGVPSYAYAIPQSQLPPGLMSDPSGMITGTPTTAGPFTFTVTVTDDAGGTATASCTINISGIQVKCPDPGELGAPYQSSVVASGGVPSYAYAIPQSQLPPGLMSDPSGMITGTPTTAGPFTFTVTVTDDAGGTATVSCTINISSIQVKCPVPGQVGVPYQSPVVASGGVPSYAYAIPQSQLPPGLMSDPSGMITGTPTTAGPFTFTVTVTDDAGGTATASCTINITGTFLINAVLYSWGAPTGPDGPFNGLTFVDAATGSLLPSVPLGSGAYSVTIPPGTTGIALGQVWVNNGFFLVTATGGTAPQTIPITSVTSILIFVAGAVPDPHKHGWNT